MSWSCYCSGATTRGREHMPGAYAVCPYCQRTRAHSELRYAAKSVLDAETPEETTAALSYLGAMVAQDTDDE